MARYEFTPNDFAVETFNIKARTYKARGVTAVMEKALGKKKCDEYLTAQDPFSQGRKENEVTAIMNRSLMQDWIKNDINVTGDMLREQIEIKPIGTIRKIDRKVLGIF